MKQPETKVSATIVRSDAARLVTATLVILAVAPAIEARDMSTLLPAETHTAFWVNDVSEAQAQAEQNAYYRVMKDEKWGVGSGPEAVTRTLARMPITNADPLLDVWRGLFPALDSSLRGGLEATTSVFQFTPPDVTAAFQDGFAIYSTMYDLTVSKQIEVVEWDIVLAGEYTDESRPQVEAFLAKALAKIPSGATKTQTQYYGKDLFHIEYYLEEEAPLPGEDSAGLGLLEEIPVIVEYAFLDGIFLLAEGRGKPLERAIRAVAETDSQFKLNTRAAFQQAQQQLGEAPGQFHYYYDLAHHIREWRDWPSQRANVRLMQALGLRDAGPILVNGDIREEAVALRAAITTVNEPDGVLALFLGAPTNQFESLTLVPPDAQSIGLLSIDLEKAYQEWLAAMAVLQPQQQALIGTMVKNIENTTQVNLERDLLSGSRGEMMTYMHPASDPSATNPVELGYLIPLNGTMETAASFNNLMRALTGEPMKVLDLEASDFAGVTIWESPQTATGRGGETFLAATPRGLIMATSGTEARDLLRRVSGESGGDITADADVARFFESLPRKGVRGAVYTKSKVLVGDLSRASWMGGATSSPPKDVLEGAVGDTWWTMHARERTLVLQFQIEAPGSATAP